MRQILLSGKVTKATRLKSGNISLAVSTVEGYPSSTLMAIDDLIGEIGYVILGIVPGESIEIPDEKPEDDQKSSSERLRNCIYVMYEQSGKKKTLTFDEYYRRVMEVLINNVKARLNPPSLQKEE